MQAKPDRVQQLPRGVTQTVWPGLSFLFRKAEMTDVPVSLCCREDSTTRSKCSSTAGRDPLCNKTLLTVSFVPGPFPVPGATARSTGFCPCYRHAPAPRSGFRMLHPCIFCSARPFQALVSTRVPQAVTGA